MLQLEPGDITDLIVSGLFEEGLELEGKRAGGNLPRSAWESISAFANGSGGYVVLGVEESPDGWQVPGVSDPARMIQDIHNLMRDHSKISHEVSREGDIWKEWTSGVHIVVIRVPPAARRHRPVFLNGDRNVAFVRRNEGDARCSDDELDRMRRESFPESADLQVIPYLIIDDFDFDAIERYRQMSQERRPTLANHRLDTRGFLRSIGAWRLDRERAVEGPTLAGILVFGVDDAIREVRTNHVIDYRRIPSDHTPSRRWTDRVRWTGHLFGAWEKMFPRLVRGLPTPFRLRGPQRLDEPAGLEALREAFVNLLVHTDYLEPSDAVVLHRDDGYIFRNPGDSWIDLRDLGIQGRSERRNPVIAQMFDNIGLADQAGSGFLRIFDEWRELGYRKPTVISDPSNHEFELDLTLAGVLSSLDRQWLAGIGGPWREEEELALAFARHHGSVDNQTLRSATGQHLFDASQTLRSLRDREYLILHGSGRGAKYELGKEAQLNAPEEPSTGYTEPSTGHTEPSTGHAIARDQAKQETRLFEIASPVSHSTRVVPALFKQTVLRLCRISPQSSDELVRLLNRDVKTVRRYVSALLDSGDLERIYPQERHPRQRYRAVRKSHAKTQGYGTTRAKSTRSRD